MHLRRHTVPSGTNKLYFPSLSPEMGVLQENFVPVGGTGNSQLCSGLNGLASKLSVKGLKGYFLQAMKVLKNNSLGFANLQIGTSPDHLSSSLQ